MENDCSNANFQLNGKLKLGEEQHVVNEPQKDIKTKKMYVIYVGMMVEVCG